MATEYAPQPTLGNTRAITFRPAQRLTFPTIMAERAGLLEIWRTTPDDDIRHRAGQRLIALNRALVLRFGAVLVA